MATIPTIIICPEAQAASMSVVWEAMGQGPDVFLQARTLCAADPSATASTPPTHRLINDAALPLAVEDMARKMAAGEAMPQVNWSEFMTQGGVSITESQAIAAATSITVVSAAGALAGAGDIDEMLAVYDLQFVPEVQI